MFFGCYNTYHFDSALYYEVIPLLATLILSNIIICPSTLQFYSVALNNCLDMYCISVLHLVILIVALLFK
jgi:hypothetical protein